DTNRRTLVILLQFSPSVIEAVGTDTNLIIGTQHLISNWFAVNIHTVGTLVVENTITTLHFFQHCMACRNLHMIEYHIVPWRSSDGKPIFYECNRRHFG